VNGFQGAEYSTSQSVRNEIFRPKVAAIIDIVLNRTVSYSVQGRAGEVHCFSFGFCVMWLICFVLLCLQSRRGFLPPVEVIFEVQEDADEFRFQGQKLAKQRREGVSHLYFNACQTLGTR